MFNIFFKEKPEVHSEKYLFRSFFFFLLHYLAALELKQKNPTILGIAVNISEEQKAFLASFVAHFPPNQFRN